MRRRSERAADGAGAMVTQRLRGRARRRRRRHRLGSARLRPRARQGEPRRPEATTGPIGRANGTMVRRRTRTMVRSGRVRAVRGDRQVARRGRRTAGPSTAGPGTGRAGSPPGAPATIARSAVPGQPQGEGAARRDRARQVAEDRGEQRRVADRDGPDPAGLGRVAVRRAARRPGRGTASRAGSPGAGSGGRPDGPTPSDLAIERVDRRPRAADARRRPARRRSSSNATGAMPDGSEPNASGRCGRPIRFSSGTRGHDPERRVQRVADRLGAVRGGRPERCRRRRPGATRVEERPADARALELRAGRTASRGTTAARA